MPRNLLPVQWASYPEWGKHLENLLCWRSPPRGAGELLAGPVIPVCICTENEKSAGLPLDEGAVPPTLLQIQGDPRSMC